MKIKSSKQKISTTVLISMTDVVFLLIIFLLLSSNFAAQTGLPIKLPASTSAQTQAPQVLHVIYENHESILFLEERHTILTLADAIKPQFASKNQVVRISAAQDTELQNVITLMDVIRSAGFERIFLATETPKEQNAR
ncbi:MAG: biopolymer transporter ExbD [Candidatus Cloacimonetes bacterium]|nr:biopolymer transporter ExbD [Candidatus Cloacimonadota bacterium]NLO10841.1 biopolymer transporter ExbD [Candidatus Cloacimonadota bacterium]